MGAAGSGGAVELLDGRLQVHGAVEAQVRTLARDFQPVDDFDLAQAYTVLGVEIEWEALSSGWGPLGRVSVFARLEGRYDCVWTRCGVFRSVDTYGDRARHLPKRLIDSRRSGFTGTVFTGDVRRHAGVPREQLGFASKDLAVGDRRRPLELFQVPGLSALFGFPGPNGMLEPLGSPTSDDPANQLFAGLDDCVFASRRVRGSANGRGSQVLGPWNPGCRIQERGTLRRQPNPFRNEDFNPILGDGGSGALPYRPAPDFAAADPTAPRDRAQGLFYPNLGLSRRIRQDDWGNLDQNFRQAELEWNRGASQQDEKELKELFVDLDLFEDRLWLRIGKQHIVWGKTELFRTTDQFNPQDIGLATLPTLEESRIALWAVRATYSIFRWGFLDDVNLELALNFDQFEPTDVGACGEAYAPNPVCGAKAFGAFAHGLTDIGLAGEIRPDDPWEDAKGIEVGARIQFRWGGASFALSDFWGYGDGGFTELIFDYGRNVDPATGRPRWGRTTGPCRGLDGDGAPDDPSCLLETTALERHHANQTLFALVCASSVGFLADLDPSACAQTIFNSQALVDTTQGQVPVMVAVGSLLAGDPTGGVAPGLVQELTGRPLTENPLVPLSIDPGDGPFLTPVETSFVGLGLATTVLLQHGLQGHLTDEQEALLGCGPFYGTFCDASKADGTGGGVDLLNAEASALAQSFVGFEGTSGDWDTRDDTRPQPGTVGYAGGPVCTRYEGGRLFILPGCRGVARDPDGIVGTGDEVYQPGYDVNVDGSVDGPGYRPGTPLPVLNPNLGWRTHPFTNQPFASEMAVLSFNLMMSLVLLSAPGDPANPDIDEFDVGNPERSDGCSLAKPQLCEIFQGFVEQMGVERATLRAGGNGRFGRRSFLWHQGGDAALRYRKRNVLGFAMDFAEDRTNTNWGLEATWIHDVPRTDNDEPNLIRDVDVYNLTVSVDRSAFIGFVNPGRGIFFNTQWFLQYVDGYRKGFTSSGPWNVLGTFTITTGYLQDRLLPSLTLVYDLRSNSGGTLAQLTYRASDSLSISVGLHSFWGRFEAKPAPLVDLSIRPNRVGRGANHQLVENALSVLRDLDELTLRVRYAF